MGEDFEVFFQDLFPGPMNGRGGDRIERLDGVLPGHGLVMIAPDQGQRLERPDLLDGFVGRSAVSDEVSEANIPVEAALLGEFEERVQGLEIAVNVAEDQGSHGTAFRPRSNEAWSVWA
jgi:hypothetical protein